MKPGNLPVLWTRYSDHWMTRTECEKMFSIPKEPGRLSAIKFGWKTFFVWRLRTKKSENITL
nr:DUF1187 family protein [Escherichia coli]